ncbi:MAG: ATP-binding protein [Fibrobacterales bacterium]
MGSHQEIKNQDSVFTLYSTLVIAFSLLVLVSCASIGFLTYFSRAEGIRLEHYRLLETLRDEKARVISDWYHERLGDVRVTTTRKDIHSLYTVKRNSKNYQAIKDEIKSTLLLIGHEYDYEALFLTDPQGTTIVTTETNFADMSELPLRMATLNEVIKKKAVIVSDVLISKVHNRATIFIFAPIFSKEAKEFIGMLGILTDPSQWLYKNFTQSEYLGRTGEILLVNRDGIAQSPLKFQKNAVAKAVINAEPSKRGAEGKVGRIEINDYRPEPVMAAYGYIAPFDWGIVVKQDMKEINAPVYAMAMNVASITIGVLLFALLFGLLIARKISKPALSIAEAIDAIGKGAFDTTVPEYGPTEIRKIAINVNSMVNQLGIMRLIQTNIRELLIETGKHNTLHDLFEGVLPVLAQSTHSQMGVAYTALDSSKTVELNYVYGGRSDNFEQQLLIDPPDNLLTKCLKEKKVQIFDNLSAIKGLVINTIAGPAPVQSFMTIPLIRRGDTMGVIGLASFYDFDTSHIQIAEEVSTTLAQAIEICKTFELSEKMRKNINERNIELQSKSLELNKTTEGQKALIVELEEQKLQVAEADKLKSEFLSNMSHELRTPLNSVLSLTQFILMQEGELSDVDTRRRLKVVERNGEQLLSLINNILDLSKIESGKTDFYVTHFKIIGLIQTCVTSMQSQFDRKGIALNVHCSTELMMESDYDKLHQILLNLLSNAHKFTEDGAVDIEVIHGKNTIVINITDTGCGIPQESLDHIFDEFRQADGSITRKYMGTGLGLAICRKLLVLLDGTITVESRENVGTTFTVLVPDTFDKDKKNVISEYSATEIESTIAPPVVSSRKNKSKILIVEDNPDNMMLAKDILSEMNVDICEAWDGEEAIQVAAGEIPDLILMDANLPKLSGMDSTKVIRQNEQLKDTIIIALTAKTMAGDKELFINAGCDDYLSKPYYPNDLIDKVNEWLNI